MARTPASGCCSWVALGGDLVKSVLGVLHHRRRDHIGRIGSRRGFVRLVTAYRAFARCSAGLSLSTASRSRAGGLHCIGRSCDNSLEGLLTLRTCSGAGQHAERHQGDEQQSQDSTTHEAVSGHRGSFSYQKIGFSVAAPEEHKLFSGRTIVKRESRLEQKKRPPGSRLYCFGQSETWPPERDAASVEMGAMLQTRSKPCPKTYGMFVVRCSTRLSSGRWVVSEARLRRGLDARSKTMRLRKRRTPPRAAAHLLALGLPRRRRLLRALKFIRELASCLLDQVERIRRKRFYVRRRGDLEMKTSPQQSPRLRFLLGNLVGTPGFEPGSAMALRRFSVFSPCLGESRRKSTSDARSQLVDLSTLNCRQVSSAPPRSPLRS